MHTGEAKTAGGRAGEGTTTGISGALHRLNFQLARFKTGTPPRLNGRTIDYSQTEIQPGDDNPQPFSFVTDNFSVQQIPCWITFTNSEVHQLIRGQSASGPDVQRPDSEQRAALLSVDRRQDRQICRQRSASTLSRTRRPGHARSLRQRSFHQSAARCAGSDVQTDSRLGKRANHALWIRGGIRFLPARSIETDARNKVCGWFVLRWSNQRHDRLRRSRRPGLDCRSQRGTETEKRPCS